MRPRRVLSAAAIAALTVLSPMPAHSESLAEDCRNLDGSVVCAQRWDGFLSCSARNPGPPSFSTSNCDLLGVLGDHESQHLGQADVGLKTIVVAMVWEPSERSQQPYLHHDIFVSLNNDEVTGQNHVFRDGAALPGLEYRLDADPSDPLLDWDRATEPIPIQFRISAGSTGDLNVVIQQPFTVHYHLFYGEHAPDGYSALP